MSPRHSPSLNAGHFLTIRCGHAGIGLKIRFIVLWAACYVLAALTYIVWQHRFVLTAVPPNASFEQSDAGWIVPSEGVAFEMHPGSSTLVRLTRSPGRPVPRVARELQAQGQQYVWIRCEYASRNLAPGTETWRAGRIICYGVDHVGREMYNRQHHAARAEGTQTWRKAEAVFELDPSMEHVWVALENQGTSGEFAVRNFDLAFVHDRPGITWLVPVLLIGWSAWLVAMMRLSLGSKVSPLRLLAGSAVVLSLFWIMSLPGIEVTTHPLGAKSFNLAETPRRLVTHSDNSQPMDRPLDERSAGRPSRAGLSAGTTNTSATLAAASSTRHTAILSWVSRDWNVLYLPTFFSLSLVLLLLTDARAVWKFSAAMAVLVQGVEWLEFDSLDSSDAVETLFAFAGIALALWVWNRISFRKALVTES